MFVPAKTPADIVSRLHAETSRALRSKEVIERLQVLGAEGSALSQQEFAALTKADARSVAEMIKCVFRPIVTGRFGIVTGDSGDRDRPSVSAHRDRPFRDRDRPFRRS